MATTSPARIDDELYASAKLVGEVQSRSASQQVVHWARIGRELEASGIASTRDIVEVLAGSRSYDGLSPTEQAMVRAEWSTRMDERRAALNLADEFAAEGRTWVELDEDRAVVEQTSVQQVSATTKTSATSRKTTGNTKATARPGTRAKGPAKGIKATRKSDTAARSRTAKSKVAARSER